MPRVQHGLQVGTALAVVLFSAWTMAADTQPAAPTTTPTTALTTAPVKFTLNFKDVPLDTVLDYFSQTVGFEILKDGAIDARVTLMSKQPVSAEEAVTMLTAALRANGYTALRQGRLLQINSREKAKKGNVPVHFGNDPDDVPQTEELITQVIPMDNISATKLRDDLKPLIGPDADVTANEASNSIIVTDTSANIHRLVRIISQLDAHQATSSELRLVQLKHANASTTAKMIETFFKTAAPEPSPQQQQMMMRGGPPQPNQGAPSASEQHGPNVVVAADDRTNTLLIMAPPPTLKVIDGILKELDVSNSNSDPAVSLRLFPLKYAAADATAKLLNNLFKAPASSNGLLQLIYGEEEGSSESEKKLGIVAQADERTNSVVVTGPAEKMKDVEALIQKLDASPMVSQDLRVIHLKYADAAVVAKLVEDMFAPKKEDQGDNGPIRLIFLGAAPPEQQVGAVKITVTFDERTNMLLVSGPAAVLDTIEHVVHELDADPTTEDTMFIYHLRNGQAQHLGYTLNVLFGNISGAQNQQNQPNPFLQQLAQFQQNQAGQSAPNGRSSQNSGNGSNLPGASPRGKGTNQPGGAASPVVNELTGKVFVVAEPDTNALLVTTASKYERQVRRIIDDLDAPVRQVLIKVLVAEVTHDNGDQFGVDFSVLNDRQSSNNLILSGQTTTTAPPVTSVTSSGIPVTTGGGTTVTNTFTTPVNTYNQTATNNFNGSSLGSSLGAAAAAASSPGGLVYSLLEHNVTATIEALQTEGKLDVLSRPYILTSDNQEATIVIGEEDPFVSDTRVETTGQLVNTIDYRQIGVILDVTPHVNPDGLVVMDVSPQVSQRQPGGVVITQGVISPIYSTRTATAHVAISDGTTIVIGGMMQDQVNEVINKVPFLGDLPLVGLLFQNHTTQKTKTELLFFLTPHVAPLPEKLKSMSEAELTGAKLVPKAVGPGVFQEYMRGMKLGGPPDTQTVEPSPVKSIRLDGQPDDERP